MHQQHHKWIAADVFGCIALFAIQTRWFGYYFRGTLFQNWEILYAVLMVGFG